MIEPVLFNRNLIAIEHATYVVSVLVGGCKVFSEPGQLGEAARVTARVKACRHASSDQVLASYGYSVCILWCVLHAIKDRESRHATPHGPMPVNVNYSDQLEGLYGACLLGTTDTVIEQKEYIRSRPPTPNQVH